MKFIHSCKINVLGRVLARCPTNTKVLYPLYEAAHPELKIDEFCDASVPAALDGFQIAFFSDVHYGPCMPLERVRAVYDRVSALKADIVIMGGDYGASTAESIALHKALHVPFARCAVVAVMGNHDRYEGTVSLDEMTDAIAKAGAVPLVNGAFELEYQGVRLAVASVDDHLHGSADIPAAVNAARGADFTIFCPHSPDVLPCAYFADDGKRWFSLALCGHTHGGQIALFGHGIVSSSKYGERFRTGWKCEYGIHSMISNGVGASFLPLRIGAPPQIHMITLHTPPRA